jgi:hypothetical protein
LVDLYDRWARTIAKRFVRETRFDPLLNAATEQALYVQLHKQIVGLGDGESTSVTIPSGGRRFTIDLERQIFADAAADAYSIIEGLVYSHTHDQQTTLLLSSRVSGLPGLADVFQSAENIDVVVLHPAAAGSAILNHASSIRSNGPDLPLVTRLPAFDDRPPGAQTISVGGPTGGQRREDGPTHLVIDGVAHRLSERPLAIDARDGHGAPPAEGRSAGPVTVRLIHGRAVIEAPAEARAFVNDQLIDGPAELLAGDRLRVGANEILLVKTAD